MIDFYHYIESMHAVIIVTRLARTADLSVDAGLEEVVERVYESK